MTDEEKKDATESAKSGTERTRLSEHFERDLLKSEHQAGETSKKKKTFWSRLLNDLRKPRFYVEIAALVIVGIYTYQAREANKLTRQLVHGTVAPLVVCNIYAQRVVPRELTVEVACPNKGQTTADNVGGSVRISTETFPEQKVLHRSSYEFGGAGFAIQRDDSKTWTYPLEGFSEVQEMPLIIKWQEIIVVDGTVSYSDGIGGTVSRPFCQVYANYTILFPDYNERFHDGSCQEILPRLRTALKHKQEDEQPKK